MPNSPALPSAPAIYQTLKGQQRRLRDYLTVLASAEDRRDFWNEQIAGAFLGKPKTGEELVLLEQQFNFDDLNRTKALTGFWAMKLLTDSDLDTDADEIVRLIHQALHDGWRLVPNNFFDSVIIISNYDVSQITKILTKLTLLRYLAFNLDAIRAFVDQNPDEVEQHYAGLLRLNPHWITRQSDSFAAVIDRPYDNISYQGAPWSRIPAPIPTPEPNHPRGQPRHSRPPPRRLTPWQQLWQAYRDESPQGDFNFLLSFYRTNKFFCSLKKRTKAPVTNASFWTRFFYRIIFWLNVPLVLDTIYYQFWVLLKTTLKVSYDYILGDPLQPIASLTAVKKWYELFLTILFAPFILFIPLALGLISIPFNGVYLLLQQCFHEFLDSHRDMTKIIKFALTMFESWIKSSLFIYFLKAWSQFLGRIIILPPQCIAFAGPASIVIGIGVAFAYLLLQLWEKNFEFANLLDDTFLTLINTIISDPLTHLVSVTTLILTPAAFLVLLLARLVIGVATGRAFHVEEAPRADVNAQSTQANRLNHTLHSNRPRTRRTQEEQNSPPILHRRRRHSTRTRSQSEARSRSPHPVRP